MDHKINKDMPTLRFQKTIEHSYPHITDMDEALKRLEDFKIDVPPFNDAKMTINTEKISADMIHFQIEVILKENNGIYLAQHAHLHIIGELNLSDGLLVSARAGVTKFLPFMLLSIGIGLLFSFYCAFTFLPSMLEWGVEGLIAFITSTTVVLISTGLYGMRFIVPRNNMLRRLQSIFE